MTRFLGQGPLEPSSEVDEPQAGREERQDTDQPDETPHRRAPADLPRGSVSTIDQTDQGEEGEPEQDRQTDGHDQIFGLEIPGIPVDQAADARSALTEEEVGHDRADHGAPGGDSYAAEDRRVGPPAARVSPAAGRRSIRPS